MLQSFTHTSNALSHPTAAFNLANHQMMSTSKNLFYPIQNEPRDKIGRENDCQNPIFGESLAEFIFLIKGNK